MNFGARTFHRSFALWIAIPLFVSLATGLTYRVGRSWFGMEKPTGNFILGIHTGEWMGHWLSGLYILVVGLGLLAMAASGLKMALPKKTKNKPRLIHRALGLTLLLPLTVSAVTGIGFHFGSTALQFSEPTLKLLMSLHQGNWMGPALRPFYVLFVGLGLLFVLVSGLRLHRLIHR
jgi:hypothetical protein